MNIYYYLQALLAFERRLAENFIKSLNIINRNLESIMIAGKWPFRIIMQERETARQTSRAFSGLKTSLVTVPAE